VALTVTTDSATIGTTEYFLKSDSTTATYQTTDIVLQAMLDLTNMVAGDSYDIKFYEKADGTNARVFYQATVTGAQSPVVWVSPCFIVAVGWDVSMDRTAGSDRSIGWTLYQWS
jgi:hypothetical protein